MKFPERLQKIRKMLDLTQKEICEKIGIDQRLWSAYENDRAKPPIETLEKLASEFNLNLNWMICERGEMFESFTPEFQVNEKMESYNSNNMRFLDEIVQIAKNMDERKRKKILQFMIVESL